MQVACAFRSSHEREKAEEEKEETDSAHITFPGRTLSQEELFKEHQPRKTGRSNKDHKSKTNSISCCVPHKTRAQNGPIRGDQFSTQHLSEQNPKPRRTFQEHQPEARARQQRPEYKNGQHFVLSAAQKQGTRSPNLQRTISNNNLSEQNPKPRRTCRKSNKQEAHTPNTDTKTKNGQHFVLF